MWSTGLFTGFAILGALVSWYFALRSSVSERKLARIKLLQQDVMLLGADIERLGLEIAKVRGMHMKLSGVFYKRFGAEPEPGNGLAATPTATATGAAAGVATCGDLTPCVDPGGADECRWNVCRRLGEAIANLHLLKCPHCAAHDQAKQALRNANVPKTAQALAAFTRKNAP